MTNTHKLERHEILDGQVTLFQNLKRGKVNPQLLSEARRLRRKNPVSGKRLSYQKVANQLYELGYMTGAGKPYQQDFIYRMLKA